MNLSSFYYFLLSIACFKNTLKNQSFKFCRCLESFMQLAHFEANLPQTNDTHNYLYLIRLIIDA